MSREPATAKSARLAFAVLGTRWCVTTWWRGALQSSGTSPNPSKGCASCESTLSANSAPPTSLPGTTFLTFSTTFNRASWAIRCLHQRVAPRVETPAKPISMDSFSVGAVLDAHSSSAIRGRIQADPATIAIATATMSCQFGCRSRPLPLCVRDCQGSAFILLPD